MCCMPCLCRCGCPFPAQRPARQVEEGKRTVLLYFVHGRHTGLLARPAATRRLACLCAHSNAVECNTCGQQASQPPCLPGSLLQSGTYGLFQIESLSLDGKLSFKVLAVHLLLLRSAADLGRVSWHCSAASNDPRLACEGRPPLRCDACCTNALCPCVTSRLVFACRTGRDIHGAARRCLWPAAHRGGIPGVCACAAGGAALERGPGVPACLVVGAGCRQSHGHTCLATLHPRPQYGPLAG